ncbi:putative baseplate central spike tip protein [Morganella phage Mecenats66]|nr:putative baseplate central spike tip protein [Morganella phage Mecenats66]
MPEICRVGVDTVAGALIISSPVSGVRVHGSPIVVIGSVVDTHNSRPTHTGATMSSGSSKVKARGIPVCRKGDSASCGHTADSGDPHVIGG